MGYYTQKTNNVKKMKKHVIEVMKNDMTNVTIMDIDNLAQKKR